MVELVYAVSSDRLLCCSAVWPASLSDELSRGDEAENPGIHRHRAHIRDVKGAPIVEGGVVMVARSRVPPR